jgi:bacterial/archaeal transporter family protein
MGSRNTAHRIDFSYQQDNLSKIMTTSNNWLVWALLSAVFAAFTAIFAKIGIRDVDSDLATLIRTVIITLVLSGFIWVTGKWSNPLELSAKTWLFLGLSGISTGVSWVCYFRALQVGDASKVAPVDKLSLVLVAIFAFAFLGERLSVMEWFGLALVAIGVLVLAIK